MLDELFKSGAVTVVAGNGESTARSVGGGQRTSLLSSVKDVTGRNLYLSSIRSTLNEEVNGTRKDRHLDHRAHPGLLQEAQRQSWDGLNAATKEEWNSKAATLNDQNGNIYQ